jgi:hypothetical protein
LKRKSGYFEADSFSADSADKEESLWPIIPMPWQKSIRLAKKGSDPPFRDAGFRRFSSRIPLPPRLTPETKRGEPRGFRPALFGFSACFFARATRKRGQATN